MLFHIVQKKVLTQAAHFSKLCYHTSSWDPTLSGVCVSLSSYPLIREHSMMTNSIMVWQHIMSWIPKGAQHKDRQIDCQL